MHSQNLVMSSHATAADTGDRVTSTRQTCIDFTAVLTLSKEGGDFDNRVENSVKDL